MRDSIRGNDKNKKKSGKGGLMKEMASAGWL